MLLISVGTSVNIKLGKIPGMVTAICIRDQEYASYEVSYILNGEPKTSWHIPSEFNVTTDDQFLVTVGFQNGKNS